MTTPTASRGGTRATTRIRVSDNLARLVLTVFLVPAPFEVINAFAKKEAYDFRRLAIVVACLAALVLVMALMRRRRLYIQSVVGYYLVMAGLAIAAFGVVITFQPDLFVDSPNWSPTVELILSALTPSSGLLLVAAGVYLVRDQVRRNKEELEAPSPASISNPRMVRLGDHNASLWHSDLFGESPGADGLVDLCKSRLSPADLHFVAIYTSDADCLFYLDLLDDDTMRRFNIVDTPGRRRLYEQAGRTMRYLANRFDRRFRDMQSGNVVRLVADVEKGALFFYKLRSDGFLIGVTLDQTEVDPTDRKLSALANEILVYRGGRPDDDFFRK